jgi:L-lactate dehydrogenase (FMN-dependent) and related alpha-hydroxy acid dehydrogenases
MSSGSCGAVPRSPVRGPAGWLSVADARRAARRALPRPVLEFVEGGAEDEVTVRRNEAAWDGRPVVGRVLRGVDRPDLTTRVAGVELPMPVVLGPAGFTGTLRPRGELAVARAAAAAGIPYAVPLAASTTDLGTLAAANPHGLWANHYPFADRARDHDLLERAWAAGCRVLVVTVDVPVAGWRERDLRNGFTVPPRPDVTTLGHYVARPGWLARFLRAEALGTPNVGDTGVLASSSSFPALFKRDVSWSDIAAIRAVWPGRVLVKGVLSPADAVLAAEVGVDGVVVSNHGGRQLDGLAATADVLADVAACAREHGLDVLVDSGIRRGRHVVTALALGASAVLVARPYLYGLAAGGQEGVERVVALLRAEVERTLHLAGFACVADVAGWLEVRPGSPPEISGSRRTLR